MLQIDGFLARNANFVKALSLTTFATRNLSSLAVPFQGWSVTVHPVRSTVVAPPRNWTPIHAFTVRTESTGAVALTAFFAGCSIGSELGTFRTRKVELICFASGVFKKS